MTAAPAAPASAPAAQCSPECVKRVQARTFAKKHGGCQSMRCVVRVRVKARRKIVAPYRAWLSRLRACESGGNYRAVNPSGTYTGAYQFDAQTWRSVGGQGIARSAGKLEQDYRAVILRKRRGTAPWPTCG